MKKEFKEPVILIEDFTISEMVAGNCALPQQHATVTQQMSINGCLSGQEDYLTAEQALAYAEFSYLYDGSKDLDGDKTFDYPFTDAYHGTSGGSTVCTYKNQDALTFAPGTTFCSGDSSLLQNS